MDHNKAPIYDAMIQHRYRDAVSFHVPGHKAGAGLDPLAMDTFQAVMSVDLTEISGMDDLHQPEGIIREAELLAAEAFGADDSYLLVGGSTVGNLALILSICSRDDLLIVQRNVHKSVLHGLMLAGARAVFVSPQLDPVTGLAAGLRADNVQAALDQYPEAVGLVLTNPNYYGMGTELAPIIASAHEHGIPVIVDEAHGAHYGFHPDLPESALAAGADGVVQSTHKMLTAMTMGAMLHLKGSRINRDAVRRTLAIVQSSSPSYPILASLDLCRRQVALHGERLLGGALRNVELFRHRMRQLPWFYLLAKSADGGAFTTLDPLKVTIADQTGTLGGFALQAELDRRGCIAEMADPLHTLLTFGLSADEQTIERLFAALSQISEEFDLGKKELAVTAKNIYNTDVPAISSPLVFRFLSDGTADYKQTSTRIAMKPQEAIGWLAAESVVPYPPGIPLLYPGERISVQVIGQLEQWIAAGARVHGILENGDIMVRNGGSL